MLSGIDIQALLDEPELDARLVVAPLLVPAEQVKKHQASIDVRLGCHFSLAKATVEDVVDSLRGGKTERAPKEILYVPLGDSLVLHPHQFLLGETLEFVRLPRTVAAYVIGRSTWGREGLIVATAVGVHPGWSGCITLELRNLGEVPIRLYPGDVVAQLFMHKLSTAAEKSDGRSQFSGSLGPITGAHRSSTTRTVIRKIAEEFEARSCAARALAEASRAEAAKAEPGDRKPEEGAPPVVGDRPTGRPTVGPAPP